MLEVEPERAPPPCLIKSARLSVETDDMLLGDDIFMTWNWVFVSKNARVSRTMIPLMLDGVLVEPSDGNGETVGFVISNIYNSGEFELDRPRNAWVPLTKAANPNPSPGGLKELARGSGFKLLLLISKTESCLLLAALLSVAM